MLCFFEGVSGNPCIKSYIQINKNLIKLFNSYVLEWFDYQDTSNYSIGHYSILVIHFLSISRDCEKNQCGPALVLYPKDFIHD